MTIKHAQAYTIFIADNKDFFLNLKPVLPVNIGVHDERNLLN